MKVSVVAPVKNEAQFIGYSIMSVLKDIHEIVYMVAPSNDGTVELIRHIKSKYDDEKKIHEYVSKQWDFDVHNMEDYNSSFNFGISQSTGDAIWFLHPDMICLNSEAIGRIDTKPFAWFTNIKSYANDLKTVITKGRVTRWKNIQANNLGIHYYGGYGSLNEDFYFRDVTGDAYNHYGDNFERYPYLVGNSNLNVNHYCEVKPYHRRFDKMKKCLKTLAPHADNERINDLAMEHPRVHLQSGSGQFGDFEFLKTDEKEPDVFKFRDEFKKITEAVQ